VSKTSSCRLHLIINITPPSEDLFTVVDRREPYRSSHAAIPAAPAKGSPVIIGAPPVEAPVPAARELAADAALERAAEPLARTEEAAWLRESWMEEASDASDLDADSAAELIEERRLETSPPAEVAKVVGPVAVGPVAVGRVPSLLVRVARAEVSTGRAAPVVLADARADAQKAVPYAMTAAASALFAHASFEQSRTPLPKSTFVQ